MIIVSTFYVCFCLVCLELSVRMLQIDPFSEYAVYFINRILTIQPSLHEMIHDLFLQR